MSNGITLVILSDNFLNTLVKKSSNLNRKKLLFTLKRAGLFGLFITVSIFSSFSSVNIGNFLFSFLLIGFFIFNFYLFGDLSEYLFKVHYKVTSSIDRLISRTLLGYFLVVCVKFFFNSSFFSFFSYLFLAINFLYFSYPTRSRLYGLSVKSHFSEFRFLDKLEKTTFFLIIFFFLFSIPDNSNEVGDVFIDGVFGHILSLIKVNLNTSLVLVSYKYLFYFSLTLVCLYSVFRNFFSRRVCLFGILLLQTNWSFYKLYSGNLDILPYCALVSALLWLCLFAIKGLSYRLGLLSGLFLPASFALNYNFLFSCTLGFLFIFFTNRKKGAWYNLQFFKYALMGLLFYLIMYLNVERAFFEGFYTLPELLDSTVQVLKRKAFFINVFLSLVVLSISPVLGNIKLSKWASANKRLVWVVFSLLIYWCAFSYVRVSPLDSMLSVFIIISVFLSLPVIDFVFWSLNPFRDMKTGVFFLFLSFVLLDSHLEGRIKVFLRFFSQM